VEGSRRLALHLAANWHAMLPWWKYKPRVARKGTAFFGLAQRIFPRKHSFDLPGEGSRWFLKDRWIMMDHRIIVFRNGGICWHLPKLIDIAATNQCVFIQKYLPIFPTGIHNIILRH
jgi:hypothetical protein